MLDVPLVLAALSTMQIVVLVLVVLAIIILWKFVKLAFRIALIVAAAVVIFLVLRNAGYLAG